MVFFSMNISKMGPKNLILSIPSSCEVQCLPSGGPAVPHGLPADHLRLLQPEDQLF